jgi:hypothetical protein
MTARREAAALPPVLLLVALVVTSVAALLVALTGCAPEPAAAPRGYTPAQVDAIMSGWAAKQSSLYAGHILGAQQTVGFVRFETASDWPGVIRSCEDRLGGSTFVSTSSQEANDYARAVCTIEYPSPGIRDRLRTPAQLAYTYDYYVNSLVPCLATSGVAIDRSTIPSRASYRIQDDGGMFAWSPYDALSASPRQTTASVAALKAKCPSAPPGLPDPGSNPSALP